MKICIVCQKEVSGRRAVKVREDRVIRFIRRVKQLLNIAAGNELYVCEDDISKQMERRKAFEKNMLFFGVLASLAVLGMLAVVVISGRFDLGMVLSALMLGAFILLFALIFRYAPALEGSAASAVPAQAAPAEAAVKKKAATKAARRK